MATLYSTIFERFLTGVQDYNIDRLYDLSPTDMETYLTSFLIRSIPKFRGCQADLSDREDSTGQFNIDLTETEQEILTQLMTVEWLGKEVNDLKQMQQKLNDTDFRTYSEANNLKEKNNHMNGTRERVEQMIVNYQLDNFDWGKM